MFHQKVYRVKRLYPVAVARGRARTALRRLAARVIRSFAYNQRLIPSRALARCGTGPLTAPLRRSATGRAARIRVPASLRLRHLQGRSPPPARFASSSVMNVEWPSGELIVAVAASLWAQRLMPEPDHHAGLVRRRWRLDRARQARPVCLSCAWSSFCVRGA